jgi:biopolymer transport protein ExbD
MSAELGSPEEDNAPIAAINVTPFVDVALVLLVIFMITAPVLLKDALQIELPKATSAEAKVSMTLGVVVTKAGQILLDGQPMMPDRLAEAVKKALAADPNAQAILSADTDARHGDVVRAIDLVKGAGISRFAVQIQREIP